MTRSIFFLLAVVATTAFAERPAGFVGIKWASSPEEAKRTMQARPGVKFGESTDDYRFDLTGGMFAGQVVAKWVLEFPDRKFALASATLKTEGNAESLYKEFRTQLSAKYGPSVSSKKLSTAKGNSGARPPQPQPAQNQYGNISIWRFAPSLKEKTAVSITLELAGPGGKATTNQNDLILTIRYENETLTEAAEKNSGTGTPAGKSKLNKDDL